MLATLPDGLILNNDEYETNDEPDLETRPDQDTYTEEAYDTYLGAELLVPHGDMYILGHVMKWLGDQDGHPIGQCHNNPLLDTHQYEVQLGDGSTAEYTANLIAKNLYAQTNPDGRHHLIFKEIIDHQYESTALTPEDGCILGHNGNRHHKKTTKGGTYA